jgi:methylglutamate dehydrogenase subunit D
MLMERVFMAEAPLRSRSAFDDLPPAERLSRSVAQAGLRVLRRDGLRLATVACRAGKAGILRNHLKERFGLDLPSGPRRTRGGPVTIVGTAPGVWLVAAEASEGTDFVADLAHDLNGVASVADQSGGFEVLRLIGPALQSVLAKGVALDLHPEAFGPDAAAVTLADHVNVILWRVDDGDELALVIAVPRSYFGEFWSWLSESARSVGLAFEFAPPHSERNP